MPVYEYSALDRAGKTVRGIIDADSAVSARQKLRRSGIFPVKINESSKPETLPSETISFSPVFKRVKIGEISATTRQLSILLEAGIPLVASLEALILQIANPILKTIMAQVKESVNEGSSLALSLSRHPKIFSQIYVNMVKAGEASGSLDVVLNRLAEYSERQQALTGRLKAALAYPALMFIIGAFVLFFLITFIVPNITGVFNEMHQTLPLPTIALISISNFMKSFWWLIMLISAGGFLIAKRYKKTSKGTRIWDEYSTLIPVLGGIYKKTAMARFGRTLGSLLQSGVPLLSALNIVRNIVNNILFADVIDSAIEEIQKGRPLASSLSNSIWFSPIAVQMISVGEQSGELEKMLDKIADTYEREVETQIMAATSMLEPVMILFMGLLVGFIVISILLPIFEMNQMIR